MITNSLSFLFTFPSLLTQGGRLTLVIPFLLVITVIHFFHVAQASFLSFSSLGGTRNVDAKDPSTQKGQASYVPKSATNPVVQPTAVPVAPSAFPFVSFV